MIFSLVTLPAASTTLGGIGEYASPIFSDLLPIAVLIIGVAFGFFVVSFLINAVMSAFRG